MANKLDIVLEANVGMEAGTGITIGGLVRVDGVTCVLNADQKTVMIQGRDSGVFSGKAVLLPSCDVVLTLTAAWPASSRLEVCLPVVNPETGCSSPGSNPAGIQLTVWVSTPKYFFGPYTLSGFILSGKDQPALEVAEISESSSVQRSMSTVKIMFRANVELIAGSVITVTGLTGTAANKVAAMYTSTTLGDVSYDKNPLQVTGMQSHFFKQDLVWDALTGTLELTTSTTIQARSNMIISTEIQNGAQAQSLAPSPKISISSPRTDATPVSLCKSPEQTMFELIKPTHIAGTVLKSTCAPMLEMSKIGQSSPYPGESNTLTVTLATNFDYRARTGDEIVCTVAGLQGAVKAPGPMTLFGADPFSSGCMACKCPSSLTCDEYTLVDSSVDYMTFHIAGDIDAGCPYIFAFEVSTTYMSLYKSACRFGQKFAHTCTYACSCVHPYKYVSYIYICIYIYIYIYISLFVHI